MSIKKLSIVIPAYNEASTIHLILDKVLKVELISQIEKEIIITVDNTQAVKGIKEIDKSVETTDFILLPAILVTLILP